MKKYLYLIFIISFFASCSSTKNTTTNNSKSISSSYKTNKKTLVKYAEELGVSESNLNSNLIGYIDEWLGVPHVMGGQSKSGIDCSAFTGNLYREIYNENIPRTSIEISKHINEKKQKDLVEGDLVFFSFGNKKIDHVGVYLHNDKFVHVSSKKGVIISDLTAPWYKKTYIKGGSYTKKQ